MTTTELNSNHVPELLTAKKWEYFITTNNDHGSTVYSLYKVNEKLKLVFLRVIRREEAGTVINFNNQ